MASLECGLGTGLLGSCCEGVGDEPRNRATGVEDRCSRFLLGATLPDFRPTAETLAPELALTVEVMVAVLFLDGVGDGHLDEALPPTVAVPVTEQLSSLALKRCLGVTARSAPVLIAALA